MDNTEKIRIIHTWTHSFEITHGQEGWMYSDVVYKSDGPKHSVLYFDYDDMINSTLNLVSWRVEGCIKNIETETKRGY